MNLQGRGFKESAVARLDQVLFAHGIPAGVFEENPEDLQYLRRFIRHAGKDYSIEVYDGLVVMHSLDTGCQYEPLLREEFRSKEKLIEGFARRLDRFLGGGPWEGPDAEETLVDELLAKPGRLFR